jgi:hypothetical protein
VAGKVSIECQICHTEIFKWNGSEGWSVHLLKRKEIKMRRAGFITPINMEPFRKGSSTTKNSHE